MWTAAPDAATPSPSQWLWGQPTGFLTRVTALQELVTSGRKRRKAVSTGALGAGVLPWPASLPPRAEAWPRSPPSLRRAPPPDSARWLHRLFLKLSSFSVVPRDQGTISVLVKTGSGRFPSLLLGWGAGL